MTDGSARLTKLTSLPEFHVNCLPGPVSNNCTWRGHINSDRGDCLHRLRGHGLDSLLEFGFRKLMFGQRQRYRKFHSKSVTRARVCALDTLQAHRDDEQCDGDSESLSHAPTSCGPLQWRHAPRLPWYPIRNGTLLIWGITRAVLPHRWWVPFYPISAEARRHGCVSSHRLGECLPHIGRSPLHSPRR